MVLTNPKQFCPVCGANLALHSKDEHGTPIPCEPQSDGAEEIQQSSDLERVA